MNQNFLYKLLNFRRTKADEWDYRKEGALGVGLRYRMRRLDKIILFFPIPKTVFRITHRDIKLHLQAAQ